MQQRLCRAIPCSDVPCSGIVIRSPNPTLYFEIMAGTLYYMRSWHCTMYYILNEIMALYYTRSRQEHEEACGTTNQNMTLNNDRVSRHSANWCSLLKSHSHTHAHGTPFLACAPSQAHRLIHSCMHCLTQPLTPYNPRTQPLTPYTPSHSPMRMALPTTLGSASSPAVRRPSSTSTLSRPLVAIHLQRQVGMVL